MEQGINKDTRRLTSLVKNSADRLRKRRKSCKTFLTPNGTNPHRGKAQQSALDVAAHKAELFTTESGRPAKGRDYSASAAALAGLGLQN